MKQELNIEKPKMPQEPNPEHYDRPTEPNGFNHAGRPLFTKLDFIADYKQYQKDCIQYEIDLERYEQYKLIRLIKNANPKLILKKYTITKK